MMPDADGPWGRRPDSGLNRRPSLIWVVLALAAAAASWKLEEAFQDAPQSDGMRLFNIAGFVALLSAGILLSRRFHTKNTIRKILIWGTVIAVLGICYTFNTMRVVTGPVRWEQAPGTPSH